MKNPFRKGLIKDKYVLLSELGSKFNLRFSSQLQLGNKLIALDGIQKRLLLSDSNNQSDLPQIIDLVEVEAVSIMKNYGSIGQGELKTKKVQQFLRRIDLQFEFGDKDKFIVFTFFDSEKDEIHNLHKLERDAKNWQTILSKLVGWKTDKICRDKKSLLAV